jgi:hypothetical protein
VPALEEELPPELVDPTVAMRELLDCWLVDEVDGVAPSSLEMGAPDFPLEQASGPRKVKIGTNEIQRRVLTICPQYHRSLKRAHGRHLFLCGKIDRSSTA